MAQRHHKFDQFKCIFVNQVVFLVDPHYHGSGLSALLYPYELVEADQPVKQALVLRWQVRPQVSVLVVKFPKLRAHLVQLRAAQLHPEFIYLEADFQVLVEQMYARREVFRALEILTD